MITVALCTIGCAIGAISGFLLYDTAKLIRRDMRRKRKLSQELGGNDE